MSIPDIIEGLKFLQVLEVARPLLIIFIIWSIGFIKVDGEKLWAKLLKKAGEDINWKVFEKVDAIDNKLDKHIEESELEKISEIRSKFVRFAGEICQGRNHTKEQYDDMLKYIDIYEDYCQIHPDFPNNQAIMSIETIKTHYQDKSNNHTFLQ